MLSRLLDHNTGWSIIQHGNTSSGRLRLQMPTITCVAHLSFDTSAIRFCPTDEARLQLIPLYDYAARNWGHHARVDATGGTVDSGPS